MPWRETARAVVEKCVREVGLSDRPALRRKLRDAYPFGERRMWPYKVWLSEVERQCGPLSRRKTPGQPDLFDEARG